MIKYDFNGRLQYIPGGALNVQMSAWPVANNWWEPTTGSFTCVAAYQAKGAASLAASYVNLANPGTYDAAPGTAPTFDAATGWTFVSASTQWLDTGILPTAAMSAIVRFSEASIPAVMLGSYSGNNTTRFMIMPASAANGVCRVYEHANGTIIDGIKSSGTMAIAAQLAYNDGVDEGITIPGTWSGTATATLGIGKQNGFIVYCDAKIQAVAIYSTTLDATQVAEVSAAMAAL